MTIPDINQAAPDDDEEEEVCPDCGESLDWDGSE